VVKLSKLVQQDKTVTLSILDKGKFFGVLSLLEEAAHTAAAQAIRNSRILLMDKPAFEELMQQEPGCGLKIMGHICQEVYSLLNKIEQDFNHTSRYVWETGPFYL
jgi:CRP/FNR family transcriptional regulator